MRLLLTTFIVFGHTLGQYIYAAPTSEKLKLSPVFSDHMVLQRGRSLPIWGTSQPNEEITVEFAEQKVTTVVGPDGKWLVKLKALVVSTEGTDLVVCSSTGAKLVVHNVLVGDVWQASGQSNMDLPLSFFATPANHKDFEGRFSNTMMTTRLPLVRYMRTRPNRSGVVVGWQALDSPESLAGVSATALFFAMEIHQTQNIPIGILITSLGGTSIEEWLDPKTREAHPEWNTTYSERSVGLQCDTLVATALNFGITGTIWIQGEQNATRATNEAFARSMQYEEKFNSVIRGWRDAWNQGDFPFIFGQLSSQGKVPEGPGVDSPVAVIREAQRHTWEQISNTAMVVTCDFVSDWHYPQKDLAGNRLALAARRLVYGEANLVSSGPLYRKGIISSNEISLSFDYVGGGLITTNGKAPSGFAVAGEDNIWYWGNARFEGDTVKVSCPQVPNPTQLRYAWANRSLPNFNLVFNKEGLPASPFSTDPSNLLKEPNP